MGAPMARNLLAKGHSLLVCDVVPTAVAALVAAGARAATTPREVAAGADFIITMLPDSPDVERVATGLSIISAPLALTCAPIRRVVSGSMVLMSM